MTDRERQRQLDLLAIQFAHALEAGDFETIDRLWNAAAMDTELEATLLGTATELAQTFDTEAQAHVDAAVVAAVEQHLPSAEVVEPTSGPLTVADVANELFRHTPDRLPAEAHALNEQLRSARVRLPDDLGLSKLASWGEIHFGTAPTEYWKAFRQAAIKLELRRAADAEYQMAARIQRPNLGGKL
jgi:hypothetical protein